MAKRKGPSALGNMTDRTLQERKRSLTGIRGVDNSAAIAKIDRELARRQSAASRSAPESKKSYLHRMASEQAARTAAMKAPKPKPATAHITVSGVQLKPGHKLADGRVVKEVSAERVTLHDAEVAGQVFGNRNRSSGIQHYKPNSKNLKAIVERSKRSSGEESVQQKAQDPVQLSIDEQYERDRQRYIEMVQAHGGEDPAVTARRAKRDKRESKSAGAMAARAMAEHNRAKEQSVPASSKTSSVKPQQKKQKETQEQYAARLHKSLNPKGVTSYNPKTGPSAAQKAANFETMHGKPPAKPKQTSGTKRDLVMSPKQIKRRAARARKAGKG